MQRRPVKQSETNKVGHFTGTKWSRWEKYKCTWGDFRSLGLIYVMQCVNTPALVQPCKSKQSDMNAHMQTHKHRM